MAILPFTWVAGGLVLAVASEPRAAAGPRGAAEAAPVRRVEIVASRYAFEPSSVEVRQGETVELAARSKDTDHGLAIKALGVKLAIPKGGALATATFVAGQPGRYPIECSEYCGSGHKRMRAELVVAEAAR